MPKVLMFDIEGKELGAIELSEKVFGADINADAMHRVVLNHLANRRQGTQSAKTRAEVRGGGKKPWRQKGTGRARHGSTRSPQWTGGGVAFAPKPRDYSYSINKKVRSVAFRSALSSKVLDNNLIVLDTLSMEEIKTKEMARILKNLNVESKALIVTSENDSVVSRSARNIKGISATFVGQMNTYELLNAKVCIISKDAVTKLEEVYGA